MKISIQTTDMSYSYVMLQKNYTKVGVINERTRASPNNTSSFAYSLQPSNKIPSE